MPVSKGLNKEILRFSPAVRNLEGKGRLGSERVCFHGLGRAKRASVASERSSLVLPLGFHGPSCMHCSAAVWYFSLLAAAALDASASAGLVASCWKFWPFAVACFNNCQKCSGFPFLAKTGSFWRVGLTLNKEISLLRIRWQA